MKLEDMEPIKRRETETRIDIDIRRAFIFDQLESDLLALGYQKDQARRLIKKKVSEIGWSSGLKTIRRDLTSLIGRKVDGDDLGTTHTPDEEQYLAVMSLTLKRERDTIDGLSDELHLPRALIAIYFKEAVVRGVLKRLGPGAYGRPPKE